MEVYQIINIFDRLIMKRYLLLLIGSLVFQFIIAQSGMYKIHPIGNQMIGIATYIGLTSGNYIEWWDGVIATSRNLPAGTYDYSIYDSGNNLILNSSVTIVYVEWQLTYSSYSPNWGITVSGGLSWCSGSSIFNSLICYPLDGPLEFRLMQDDTLQFANEYPLSCDPLIVEFYNLPMGHTYHVELIDPHCGTTYAFPIDTAHSCDSLDVDLGVTGTMANLFEGSISVSNIQPDTTEFLHLTQLPVSCYFELYDSQFNNIDYTLDDDTAVLFTDLDTGQYHVVIYPVQGCGPKTYDVYIPLLVNTSVSSNEKGQYRISPNPTTGSLFVDRSGSPLKSRYTIVDYIGKEQLQGELMNTRTTLQLGSLKSGVYLLIIENVDGKTVVRLIKE